MGERKSFGLVLQRAQEGDDSSTLQRTLGGPELVVLGVGGVIGTGIFVATGIVAAEHTGPAIVLSFAIAAAACLCAGLCYAEFAAMLPVSGSAYSYVHAAFGRRAGWLVGWCLLLEYLMAAANVAVGWSGYFVSFLRSVGLGLPDQLTSPPLVADSLGKLEATGALVNAPAVLVLLVLTALSIAGVRQSIRATGVLVAVKLGVILLFILCGAPFVNPDNWRPFLPANTGEFGSFGWSGVFRGAAIVFYAFLGFDAVCTAAREARRPQHSVPLGIVGSLGIATLAYVAFALVLTGLASYTLLSTPSPVSVALEQVGPSLYFLKVAVEIGAIVGLTSVLLVILYAGSRVVYALAQDGLAPGVLLRIGRRSHTPYVAIILCGAVAAVASGLLPLGALVELVSIGTLTAFLFVCAGVLHLRITQPALARPFRVPFGSAVAVAGIVICGYLMASLPWATWSRFLIWLALGAAIYLVYGRRAKP